MKYTFTDANGKIITLDGSTTMEQLVKMGITKVGLVKPDEPMKPNEYRNTK
jgi:hypothetical protein